MGFIEIRARLSELIKISLPIIVEQIFITIMGMVNTAMVSSVGEHAVSAVGMIDNISNLLIALFAALTTGGAIVVAQYYGRDDRKNSAAAGGQSLLLAVVMSLIISVVFAVWRNQIVYGLFGAAAPNVISAGIDYFFIVNFSFPLLALTQTIFGTLRGSGNTGAPMLITLGMNVFNFIFGYIFILGINVFGVHTIGYGVKGAAVAITLARLAGAIASVIYIVFISKTIRLNSPKYFRPNFRMQKIVLSMGIPTSIESGLFQAGRLITQLFIVGMGTAALAANTISSNINGFINVPGNALSMGVMILIGHRVGRGELDDVKRTTLFSVICGMIVMGIICALVFLTLGPLTAVYSLTGEAASTFRVLVTACCVASPLFWASSFVTPSALRAASDVKYTMIIAIASMWLFRIAVGYILGIVFEFGVLGVWIGMFVDWMVRSVMFLRRMTSEKWRVKLAER